MSHTLLEEHFFFMGRKKFHERIEAMQKDFDAYLIHYNAKQPYQGSGMNRRTPPDVFVRCLPEFKTPRSETMRQAA